MTKKLFVNLPIKDLARTTEFFTALGFTFNQQFTDEKATCMIVNEDAYYMLLVEPFFKSFSSKEIADTKKFVECYNSISLASREEVDTLVDKAMSLGATKGQKDEDYGFMYSRAFCDLDGHEWSFFWMDPAHVE